jgi:hypothetical protein
MTGPRFDLVVARYREDVSWLSKVSPKWNIIIYNKSVKEVKLDHPNYRVVWLGNRGREAETYAYHMRKFHDNYADLTVFIQGRPFDHSPKMIELLNILVERPVKEKYIPMTIKYDDVLPPASMGRQNEYYRVDEMSVYTLNCIEYMDGGIQNITRRWHTLNNKPLYANIMKDLFEKLGRPELLGVGQKIIKFHFAACFALSREALMQYDQAFYEALYAQTLANDTMPYIFERAWLHIFDPEFDSDKVLAEYRIDN